MIYELREYAAAQGRIDDLHTRFREHTLDIFARHGIEVAGLWVDTADPNSVVYLLGFDDEEHQRRAWAAFRADPEWQAVRERSERPGPLVRAVVSRTLQPAAYMADRPGRPLSRIQEL